MATKPKAKKAGPKKAAKKKPAPKRTAKRKKATKKTTPPVVISTHRFEPGTKVGFHPAHAVEVERSEGRAPFPAPVEVATVQKNGVLQVSGLKPGAWSAVGLVGDRYLYLQFPVN